jgi:hypothetical protein
MGGPTLRGSRRRLTVTLPLPLPTGPDRDRRRRRQFGEKQTMQPTEVTVVEQAIGHAVGDQVRARSIDFVAASEI